MRFAVNKVLGGYCVFDNHYSEQVVLRHNGGGHIEDGRLSPSPSFDTMVFENEDIAKFFAAALELGAKECCWEAMTEDELLRLNGWTIECRSPFEIRHQDGSFASGQAVHAVISELREE
jgi:hypothetical protein